MSPRAAWRLEAAGFHPVYDYVAGKSDWLAADLPFGGDARLVGAFIRREVPVVGAADSVGVALDRLDDIGYGPVLAVNEAGVVMGALTREAMRAAGRDTAVREVWSFGVTTVRPSEDVVGLVQRMRTAGVTRIVVTRSDGTLVGLFFTEDVHAHHQHGR